MFCELLGRCLTSGSNRRARKSQKFYVARLPRFDTFFVLFLLSPLSVPSFLLFFYLSCDVLSITFLSLFSSSIFIFSCFIYVVSLTRLPFPPFTLSSYYALKLISILLSL